MRAILKIFQFRKTFEGGKKPKLFPLFRHECNWTFLFHLKNSSGGDMYCHSHLLIKGILEGKAIMNVTKLQLRD